MNHKGRIFVLNPTQVRGSRDHHWGLRNGVGGPGHSEPMKRFSHCGQWVEIPRLGRLGIAMPLQPR